MSAPVIEARGLVKRYGGVVAVDGIDLDVEAGEIVGLLGPNGSGKTTTILMLIGLTEADAGEVRVLGHDPLREPLEVKRRVAYLPDSVGFYETLTARENLRYTARLSGVPRGEIEARLDRALERVGLADVADRKVGGFSLGMRQRLGLAEVLAKGSRLAILDEPTGGLDPQATLDMLGLIRDMAADGVTVLLSSHLLERVQSVCDRVALFHRGRIRLMGRVTDLARDVLGKGYRIEVEATGVDPGALARLDHVAAVERPGDGLYVVEAGADIRAELARHVVEAGGRLTRLAVAETSLAEVYTHYFQEEARHAA